MQIIKELFFEKTNDTKIQFLRYIFVGGFAAVINIGSLYIFTDVLHIYYLISNVISFILGLLCNYILSKLLIFTTEKQMNKFIEFITYAIIGVIGLGLDTLIIWLATNIIGIYYMLSKIISTGLVFIWNFVARKLLYVFIDKKQKYKER